MVNANFKVNTKTSAGSGIYLVIVIVLMVAGAVVESMYDQALGATLFAIGFWLFMIPIIIIAVILGIFALIVVFSSS